MVLINNRWHLGMNCSCVIRLIEIVRPEFPVSIQFFPNPVDSNGFFELMPFVKFWRWLQILHETRRIIIHRVPDKPRPGINPDFNEFRLADGIPLGEIILIRTGL